MHESPVARLLTPISICLALGCGDAGAAASATATSDAEMTASPTTSGAASTGAATGAQATGDGSDGSGSSGSSASDGDTTAAGATSDSEPTVGGETEDPEPASRPLAVHADNQRYFDDGAGAAIVLVGVNHGWELQDDAWDVDYALDFDAFLDYLEAYQLNFIRLWRVESPKQTADDAQLATPTPYLRTGPGVANDGMPRFDLEQLDPAYFARLHERCAAAAARGIYVDIMLFERHSTFHHNGPAWPWSGHPFHASNNVNGVDADANADGQGREYFLLPEEGGDAEVLALQETYVRATIDAVLELDNVLFEICNECKPEANAWQAHMIAVARAHMQARDRVFPIGFTGPGTYDNNEFPDFAVQLASDADFVSPRDNTAYKNSPPASDGAKVIFADSDHIDPYGRNAAWVWKSFTRGLHPQALEAYDVLPPDPPAIDPARDERVRLSLGACRLVSERVDLATMVPDVARCSSGYCLARADAGAPVIAFVPGGGPVEVELAGADGQLPVEWYELATGSFIPGDSVAGGAAVELTPPFAGSAVALIGLDP